MQCVFDFACNLVNEFIVNYSFETETFCSHDLLIYLFKLLEFPSLLDIIFPDSDSRSYLEDTYKKNKKYRF